MLDKEVVKLKTKDLLVLFIEDDHLIRSGMKSVLSHYFYKTDIAQDGACGLGRYKRLYEERKVFYDIVITDISLPKINGLALIKEIQKINPKQHVIISSAYSDYENLIEALNLGVDGFLRKPFDHEHFKHLIYTIATQIHSIDEENLQKAELQRLVATKTREIEEQLKIDQLTALPNFFSLVEDLKLIEKKAFVVLDIDRFEDINSTYGMEFGNRVLKSASELLNTLVPENATLYRIGSDEYGVMFQGEITNQAEEFAKVVASFFKTYQISIEDVDLSINFSIGISYSQEDTISGGKLAVKESKEEVGNLYKVYNPDSDYARHQRENLVKVHQLKKLLHEDGVIPYFHKIVDIHTKEVVKYEALARLEGAGEVHSPAYFLQAARHTGLLTAITKSMITKSFKIAQKKNIAVSINITEQDLNEGYLTDFLKNRLEKFELEAKDVTLEILETITVGDSQMILKQIENLKKMGFVIALDDFGSENSNFSRLLDLSPEIIKIDGAFIKDLSQDNNSKKIVKSMIYLAKEIGAKVVAEFVKDEETFELVKELGVDYAQGYIFGEPERIKVSPKK